MAVGLEWGSDGFDTAWCGFGLGLGKSETNAVFQTFSSSKATARFFAFGGSKKVCVFHVHHGTRSLVSPTMRVSLARRTPSCLNARFRH